MGFFGDMLGGVLERREARNPLDDRWYSIGGNESASGLTVTTEGAMRIATYCSCIRVISQTVKQLPLLTYKRRSDGSRRRERDAEHWLYPLLHDAPNPEMSAATFKETLTAHVGYRGNGYARIEKGLNSRVRALWILDPDSISLKRDQDGVLFYEQHGNGLKALRLPVNEIFHIRGFSWNGLTGLTPISYMRDTLGLAAATHTHGAKFFANGARPGTLLKVPGKMAREDKESMVRDWNQKFMGSANAYKTAVLDDGIEAAPLEISHDDAQFLEVMKYTDTQICGLTGVPPHMIAILDNATFSNIEHQGIDFVKHTMGPWFTMWESEISRSLLTPKERGDHFSEFLVEGLMRGDAKSRYEAYRTARQWGWMNADEIRDLENMNPMPEGAGQVYLTPLNMVNAASLVGKEPEDPAPGLDATAKTPAE